jgi:NADPH-dependent 2,4-dienoyl-CoA reductase/sulfur reductase-like enzyme
VVLAGSGPLLLPVAAALADDGAHVALVAEQAEARAALRFGLGLWRRPAKVLEALRYRLAFLGSPLRHGVWVSSAAGDECVRSVTLTDGYRSWSEACDLLGVSFGLLPNLELARLLGCALRDGAVAVDARQQTSVPGVFAAGEPTGIGGVERALLEGEIAGLAAAGRTAEAESLAGRRARLHAFSRALEVAYALRPELRRLPQAGTLVCRCEDIAYAALDPGWGARRAKLYTRLGMGACQGRVCGAACSHLFGWAADTTRPPLLPAPLGAFTTSETGADR